MAVLSWQETEQSFGLDLAWVLVFQAGPQLLCHHFLITDSQGHYSTGQKVFQRTVSPAFLSMALSIGPAHDSCLA